MGKLTVEFSTANDGVQFVNVAYKDLFVYNGNIYMKVCTFQNSNANAINLSQGKLDYFENEIVHLKTGILTIK